MSLVPSLPYRYTYSYTASLIIAFHWTFETFYPILSRWFCTLSQLLSPSHSQCSCPLPRTRLEEKEPNKILLTAHNPLIQCFKGTQIPKFSVNRQWHFQIRNSLGFHQENNIEADYDHGKLLLRMVVVVGGCRSRSVPSLTLQGVRILLSPRLRTFSCHSDFQSRTTNMRNREKK